jgi:hypothetical protein
MDAETSAGGRDRTEGFALEKRRMFHRGTLAEPYLGGLSPLHRNVGLGRPRMSPRRFMTSSLLHGRFDRQIGQFGTCGSLEKPKEG